MDILLLLLLFVLISCLPGHILAVDKGQFRTCAQSSFCARQRALVDTDGISPVAHADGDVSYYALAPGTLHVTKHSATADVVHLQSLDRLTFELEILNDGTVHFTLNEKEPLRPRYKVPDVVVGDLAREKEASHVYKADEFTRFTFGEGDRRAVKIQHSPFLLEFSVDDKPALVANARGLLHFEPYLPSEKKVLEEVEEEAAEGEAKDDDATAEEREGKAKVTVERMEKIDWSETFKSHRDRRRNGPASVGMDFSFLGSSNVYGLPEHSSAFSLPVTRGSTSTEPYRLYNLDVFEYEVNEPMALYGSVPFMMSHKQDLTIGMLWLNSAETWIDVTRPEQGMLSRFFGAKVDVRTDTQWMSESGIIEVFVFLGPSPYDVMRQYAAITGPAALPQYSMIAYHQCRWNYIDEADVARVDEGFDTNDIPYDVLWLDIEHTDQKKYFTWSKENFPNPEKMQLGLASKARKMVTIIDPHIKRENNYYIHSEATSLGYYVKNAEGVDFEGQCWPGSSSWIDFTNPEARKWWSSKFDFSSYQGSTEHLFTWNDMNEPSVFSGPEVTMPKDLVHYGGWEHRDIHNTYGFYQQMSTINGLLARGQNKVRPFLLSRSYFAGSQRFGAIWTGDNAAQWSHLACSVPMLLSNSVAGIPFSGADVGGFFGNPDPELLVRWYQVAAFQPFFRAHSHIDTKRREPWLFGEPFTSLIRTAVRRRYMLLPYVYTLFHQASVDLSPVMRPLFFEFPTETETFAIQDQFLLGDALMIKPVTQPEATGVKVYFPGEDKDQIWYDYTTFNRMPSAQTIPVMTNMEYVPVYLRGGKIIVRKDRVRRSSPLMANDPFTVIVAADYKGEAEGQVYVDDGFSFDYVGGASTWKRLTFAKNILSTADASPNSPSNFVTPNIERIVFVGLSVRPKNVFSTVAGQRMNLMFEQDEKTNLLTVKLPRVNFSKDWAIQLEL